MEPDKEIMTTVKTTVLPTSIKFDDLDYKKGADFAVKWRTDLKLAVNGLTPGVFRNGLLSIVTGKGKYEPDWPDEKKVKEKYKTTSDEQLSFMMQSLSKAVADEKTKMEAVNTAIHTVLVSLMGGSSKDVLRSDVLFEKNSKESHPDPKVTWEAIIRTHITG